MPLNEAGPARSKLTKLQRQAALAAVYGVPEEFTEIERDELRLRLADPNPPNK